MLLRATPFKTTIMEMSSETVHKADGLWSVVHMDRWSVETSVNDRRRPQRPDQSWKLLQIFIQAKITNLPKKETPTVHKDSNIANMKTSVAEKSGHDWSANLVRRRSYVRTRIKSTKCYPLLLKTFEENGGVADGNKLDELEAVIGGELTRKQIVKWFHHQGVNRAKI